MRNASETWDYLVVTAGNERQAESYRAQLRTRASTRDLAGVRSVLVVPDRGGQRIGSGASTLECLSQIVDDQRLREPANAASSVEDILGAIRVLIIHAGGDSRRLPAYGPAGKIFVPVPGPGPVATPATLFDRLAPTFLNVPPNGASQGQIVITSGDALIEFDPASLNLSAPGVVIAGCKATPQEASHHGVLCAGTGLSLRLYLQKPSVPEQYGAGAVDPQGASILDIGVMSFDARAAASLLRAFAQQRDLVMAKGVDLYREICCAFGSEATLAHYVATAHASGSAWSEAQLSTLYPELHAIPAQVCGVPSCRFLHFGSTRQLISSGTALAKDNSTLSINNEIQEGCGIAGRDAWVEGCRISAPLQLAGSNALIGADIYQPVRLPEGVCVDVLEGTSRQGSAVFFVRCYGIDDTFKQPLFFGKPMPEWLGIPSGTTLWDAPVFPAVTETDAFTQWLWLADLHNATPAQQEQWLAADRYSTAEIAVLADPHAFHERRRAIHEARAQSVFR